MADSLFLDTNILVRLFARDEPEQLAAVEPYLRAHAEDLVVTAATVSEVLYVLRGRTYGFERARLADAVERVLALPITVLDRDEVALALQLYREYHDDWDDCLVAAYALRRADGRLVSFDRGLDRLPGLSRLMPALGA